MRIMIVLLMLGFNAVHADFYAVCSDDECVETSEFRKIVKTTICDDYTCETFNLLDLKESGNQYCDSEKCFTFIGKTAQGIGEFESKIEIEDRYGNIFNVFADGFDVMFGVITSDAVNDSFANIQNADNYIIAEGSTKKGFFDKLLDFGKATRDWVINKVNTEIENTDQVQCFVQKTDGSRRGFNYTKSGGWKIIYIAPEVEENDNPPIHQN